MPQILIGTAGWHYASWWGPFFPKEVRKKDALVYYATRFKTAELNAPFYRTPTIEALKAGATILPTISSSPGRPRNSSRIGSA